MMGNTLRVASSPLPPLIGESAAMQALRLEIEQAGKSHAKVLIVGETGVGKEVVARMVHAQSPRRTHSFVAVNCAGIPETLLVSELFGHVRGSFTGAYRDRIGLVRQADHGTLFLDELGEMSLSMQAMLLRFAEAGEIQPVGSDAPVGRTDVRLITATNRHLPERIADGTFREDLYYRLNVIQIRIPPLRERGSDILILLRFYLQQASVAHQLPVPDLSSCAEEALLHYLWPGNVRELKNVTERLVLRDTRHLITARDLPAELHAGTAVMAPDTTEGATTLSNIQVSMPSTVATVDRLWEQLAAGHDFWNVVHRPFRVHELTRGDLVALIDRGLQHTLGSYRALLTVFNLPPSDYKRFHAFLYQQKCNLPVRRYRNTTVARSRRGHMSEQFRAVRYSSPIQTS